MMYSLLIIKNQSSDVPELTFQYHLELAGKRERPGEVHRRPGGEGVKALADSGGWATRASTGAGRSA